MRHAMNKQTAFCLNTLTTMLSSLKVLNEQSFFFSANLIRTLFRPYLVPFIVQRTLECLIRLFIMKRIKMWQTLAEKGEYENSFFKRKFDKFHMFRIIPKVTEKFFSFVEHPVGKRYTPGKTLS